jgi:hypothetical protein
MDFLPGFAFPVPRAFTGAIASGRFEQGDVLYDDSSAYAEWTAGSARFAWVQVLDPPRTARATALDADGNRFAANWISPVTVERGGRARPLEHLRCCQGHLFTSLWRGDFSRLEPRAAGDAPPLPRVARDLQRELEVALPAVRRAAPRGLARGALFASVVDESSEASLAKDRAIRAALSAGHAPPVVDLSPVEAGIPGGDDFHPTLRVRALLLGEHAPEQVRERLKQALYGAVAGGEEGRADRFKLARHGLLVGPEGRDARTPE